MACLNLSYIYMLSIAGYAAGISTTHTNVCKNNGSFPSVNIDCYNNGIIHIESIQYFYKQGSNCNTQTCGQPLTNSDTGLTSTCTGQSSPCLQVIPNNNNCTGSTVTHRCIARETIQNICAKDFELKQSDSIFLSSPQYPELVNGLPGESCECFIRGTSITSITILDLRLKTSNDGVRSNLFIQYGNVTYNQASRDNSQPPVQVYNHRLQTTTTTTADIKFTHKQINEQKLWIEIQGTNVTGFCNNTTRTPTTPFVSSSSLSRPDTSTNLPSTRPISIPTTAFNAATFYITSSGPTATLRPEISSGPTSTQTPEISSGPTSTQAPEISSGLTSTQTPEISSCLTSTQTPEISSGPTSTQTPEISSDPTSKPPTDNGVKQTDGDNGKDAVIIVLALILSLSLVLVIVLAFLYRKGKLKCLKQPGNPGAENPRTITQLEPVSNYSNLSDVTRNNTDNTYQELQTRNSNSPYTNLPYTSSSEMD